MVRESRRVLAGCLVAAALGAQAQQAQTPEQTPDDQSDAAPSNQDTEREPSKPARTFTPSEEIGADSAVSFPVDI